MNYIYDIILNFNNYLYDFYEWNLEDKITHVKKTPVFKINTEDFINLRDNIVKVSGKFIDMIYNKTEVFSNNNKFINYLALFTDGHEVISLKFMDNGKSTKISALLLDEAEEVTQFSKRFSDYDIEYEIIEKRNSEMSSRDEIEGREFLKKELQKIYNNKDFDKLNYLYYEFFDKKSSDFTTMYNDIINSIKDIWNDKHYKLYELMSLSTYKKQI